MIVIGGLGTIWGPLVGAALLMVADEALKEASDFRNIGLGLLLAAFVVLLPQGMVGLFDRRRHKRGSASPPSA
jgi:branched-chain amino acid transport system permease protein